MTTWLLIFYMAAPGGFQGGPGVAFFLDKETCEVAGKILKKEFPQYVKHICIFNAQR